MSFTFNCYGHKNIRAMHKTTLEFTKDSNIGVVGDCIIGVDADYDFSGLKKFIFGKKRIRCTLTVLDMIERFNFLVNPSFDDKFEIVIRLGHHISERTLGTDCDKSAFYLNREFVEKLKKPGVKMVVNFEEAV